MLKYEGMGAGNGAAIGAVRRRVTEGERREGGVSDVGRNHSPPCFGSDDIAAANPDWFGPAGGAIASSGPGDRRGQTL